MEAPRKPGLASGGCGHARRSEKASWTEGIAGQSFGRGNNVHQEAWNDGGLGFCGTYRGQKVLNAEAELGWSQVCPQKVWPSLFLYSAIHMAGEGIENIGTHIGF